MSEERYIDVGDRVVVTGNANGMGSSDLSSHQGKKGKVLSNDGWGLCRVLLDDGTEEWLRSRLCKTEQTKKKGPLMHKCTKCNDSGVWETGNNDLPCDCPAGSSALFNVAGVDGAVTGHEMKKHFFNDSPQPIRLGKEKFSADDLPGRKKS